MDRRDFLTLCGTVLAATPGLACARVSGSLAAVDEFRALVCVYLLGGSDSFNMLVPRSRAEYRAYAACRGHLAVPREKLLPIATPDTGSRRWGTHAAMHSLRSLFREGTAAFVANVGALVEPGTRDDYYDGRLALPPRLFSHDGRREPWSSLADTSSFASDPLPLPGGVHRARGSASRLRLRTIFPRSPLGARLEAVARLVAMRDELAMRRQVFFVAAGGFDSHDNQAASQPGLLADLSGSLAAFHRATVELGVADNVTAFTQSDFGRTLSSNGSGTDHAWGGNQIVLGGAVLGGRLYGSYPELRVGGPEDVGGGRFVPSTSCDQFAATLATWFGMPDRELHTVAPNLGNFSIRNLGFMA